MHAVTYLTLGKYVCGNITFPRCDQSQFYVLYYFCHFFNYVTGFLHGVDEIAFVRKIDLRIVHTRQSPGDTIYTGSSKIIDNFEKESELVFSVGLKGHFPNVKAHRREPHEGPRAY